jgi:hypothetical protein
MRSRNVVSSVQKCRPNPVSIGETMYLRVNAAYDVSASDGTSHRKYPAIRLGVKKKGTDSSYRNNHY